MKTCLLLLGFATLVLVTSAKVKDKQTWKNYEHCKKLKAKDDKGTNLKEADMDKLEEVCPAVLKWGDALAALKKKCKGIDIKIKNNTTLTSDEEKLTKKCVEIKKEAKKLRNDRNAAMKAKWKMCRLLGKKSRTKQDMSADEKKTWRACIKNARSQKIKRCKKLAEQKKAGTKLDAKSEKLLNGFCKRLEKKGGKRKSGRKNKAADKKKGRKGRRKGKGKKGKKGRKGKRNRNNKGKKNARQNRQCMLVLRKINRKQKLTKKDSTLSKTPLCQRLTEQWQASQDCRRVIGKESKKQKLSDKETKMLASAVCQKFIKNQNVRAKLIKTCDSLKAKKTKGQSITPAEKKIMSTKCSRYFKQQKRKTVNKAKCLALKKKQAATQKLESKDLSFYKKHCRRQAAKCSSYEMVKVDNSRLSDKASNCRLASAKSAAHCAAICLKSSATCKASTYVSTVCIMCKLPLGHGRGKKANSLGYTPCKTCTSHIRKCKRDKKGKVNKDGNKTAAKKVTAAKRV